MKKLLVAILMLIVTLNITTVQVFGKGNPKAAEPVVYDGGYEELCYADGELVVDLWAGQHILAGSVVVTLENGYLSVSLDTPYPYDEVHIGTYSELPAKRPAPGQMEFVEGEYQVGDTLFLIVHVAFTEDEDSLVSGETAYAGNTQTGTNAWFYYIPLVVTECTTGPEGPGGDSETAYAYFGENSIEFNPNGGAWGWYAEFAAGTYTIYAGAGQNDLSKGEIVGTITVYEDGTYLVEVEEGFEFTDSHLYIGSEVPERIPGQWNEIDMTDPLYMTFHFVVVEE